MKEQKKDLRRVSLKEIFYRMTGTAKQSESNVKKDFRQELKRLQTEMEIVRDHFENETDLDLIDAHIWEMKSLEVRYGRAIREAKLEYKA